jgi:hypothetical protein
VRRHFHLPGVRTLGFASPSARAEVLREGGHRGRSRGCIRLGRTRRIRCCCRGTTIVAIAVAAIIVTATTATATTATATIAVDGGRGLAPRQSPSGQ